MNIFFIAFIVLALIGLFFLFRKIILIISGFELLITKFVEYNQEFYEGQKSIVKKDKELTEALVKQNGELSVMRRQATKIQNNTQAPSESVKSLKENEKSLKDTVDELVVSKQIANALAISSGNIKILDNLANEMKKMINSLKRSK